MSATDPRPQNRCTCRHEATSHRKNGKGQRQQCTSPRCDCPRFVSARVAQVGRR